MGNDPLVCLRTELRLIKLIITALTVSFIHIKHNNSDTYNILTYT
jgi:hypothetical protein